MLAVIIRTGGVFRFQFLRSVFSGDCTMNCSLEKCRSASASWPLPHAAGRDGKPALAAKPVPSLDLVPADAAFYSAMLRNREQFDAIVNSKAFAKIKALPYVQMGLALYANAGRRPGFAPGPVRGRPPRSGSSSRSLNFLADLLSDEVFIYGGPSFNQAVELLQGVYGDVQFAASWRAFASAKPSAPENPHRRDPGPRLRPGPRQADRSHQVPRIGDWFQGQRQGPGQGTAGPS